MTERKHGWAFPLNARKAHYFNAGRSLCGTWFFLGEPSQNQKTGGAPGPDDCKTCWRRARKAGR